MPYRTARTSAPVNQVHAVYVVPADLADRSLDTDGTIGASVSNLERWLRDQTGGRMLRVDTYLGQPDVSFVRLRQTDVEVAATGKFVREVIERELRALGFADPLEIYATVRRAIVPATSASRAELRRDL